MSKNYYKHFQSWEKCKLEQILLNQPVCRPIYGTTPHGWDIVSYKWLVNISQLSFQLHKERKTIRNELLRGKYWTLVDTIGTKAETFNYSKDASDHHKKKIISTRQKQNTKILNNPKLCDWVKSLIPKQSLKGIGGRSKIVFAEGLIETTISHVTLYSYIANEHIEFIDNHALKRQRKQHYRQKYQGKRQNGVSIDERPDSINNRSEFGHWEIDLIEGKRGTKTNVLTMYERKVKKGIAMKIHGKEAKEINKTLRKMQTTEVLVYGQNIKSITTDNGSEFWQWEIFCKSIYSSKDDISVYFAHSYCSWEKGGVENFNQLMRTKYHKGTDFTNVSQKEIDMVVEEINNLYRESLGYLSANEMYNAFVST